jgi:microcystin-dependent protein
MGDYYIGEIRAFACDYAPQDWALCDGSLLPVQQNAALYSLLGTQYGGDGKINFALPDLRGRVPVGTGVRGTSPAYTYNAGNNGGAETVALQTTEIPPHNHPFFVKNAVGTVPIIGAVLGIPNTSSVQLNVYNPNAGTTIALNAGTILNTGTGAKHNNMQPFQTINFCIAIRGLYPMRP